MGRLRFPTATYRLQLNDRFGFADARALLPYLNDLGVSDLYLSPIFQARSGSTHGYDQTDPTQLNSDLGGQEEFERLCRETRLLEMGLLLDIVPNHMAVSSENRWWTDVLENGQASPYSEYFDISWKSPAPGQGQGKVVIPVLGDSYEQVLQNGQLSLHIDEGGFHLRYHESRFPVEPKSYGAILGYRLDEPEIGVGHDAFTGLLSVVDQAERLPDRANTNSDERQRRLSDGRCLKKQLWRLYTEHPEVRRFVDANLSAINGAEGDEKGYEVLDQLLALQSYKLTHWRMASQEINYRRFFDINDLIGVRVEDREVFDATHRLALELVEQGKVTGLRIDHIDGLYDPLAYLHRLQDATSGKKKGDGRGVGFYVVVEKILGDREELPPEWPVCGTTGYDFLNVVNGIFVDPQGLSAVLETYSAFTQANDGVADVVHEGKKQAAEALGAELDSLARELYVIQGSGTVGKSRLLQALVEVAACLPVYRTYVRDFLPSKIDRTRIEFALHEARSRNPSPNGRVWELLREALLLDVTNPSDEQRQSRLRFVMRWQQFTGPIMAKGVEDTAFYRYNPLTSLNEVGGHYTPTTSTGFHLWNQRRRQQRYSGLNATSTHDTKRSEDVRSRINVLSEVPEKWSECLGRWSYWNLGKRRNVDGHPVPARHEEVLLYQTLLGAWPLDQTEMPAFKERVQAYMVKAAREAKLHTSWTDPDVEHEGALAEFVEAMLGPSADGEFLQHFNGFQQKIAYFGMLNSLAQTLLKITAPGVPDLYQGTEMWDLTLVDPDNRRPVDFGKRIRLLDELKREEMGGHTQLLTNLLETWSDGRVKLYLTFKALKYRRARHQLFLDGDYTPVVTAGPRKDNVLAYAISSTEEWALVAVPRLCTQLCESGKPPLGTEAWLDTTITLPAEAPIQWKNILTRQTLSAKDRGGESVLPLAKVFQHFPVALLTNSDG